ncbi:UNVERIFIED_CONTAM: hypothetical protein RMT77_000426 [Armadillidium vulgare]
MIFGFIFLFLFCVASSLHTNGYFTPHGNDGASYSEPYQDDRTYNEYNGQNIYESPYPFHKGSDQGRFRDLDYNSGYEDRRRNDGPYDNHWKSYGNDDEYRAPADYNFGYGVYDPYHGTNFGHRENRNGKRTDGEYYVDLPDGRLQKVSYYADKDGYHPTITYIGKAHYPTNSKHHGTRY